ncbi:hypothetical protein LG314_00215 [Agrococcus terreus]|uniref:hypothetical protein n=1 Tax=Agrococcus terreus TaxID=574649 RepID=UPI00384F41F9
MPALLDRLRPLPAPEDPDEFAGVQADRARSARAWLLAGVVGAHAASLAVLAALSSPLLVIALATAAAALWMLAVGAGQVVLHLRAEPRGLRDWLGASALVALGLLTAPFAGVLAFVGGGFALCLPAALVLVGLATTIAGFRRPPRPRESRGAMLGLAAALVAVALAAIDTLVMLPTTIMPGMPLEEVYAALGGLSGHAISLVAALCVGYALGAALLATGLWASGVRSTAALGIMLWVATLALFSRVTLGIIMGWAIDDLGGVGGLSLSDAPLWLLTTAVAAGASWLTIGRARLSGAEAD